MLDKFVTINFSKSDSALVYFRRQKIFKHNTITRPINSLVRGRPFDSWGGGGYGFFVKKKIVQEILENK